MKYMLMMNTMKAGSTGLNGWSEKDIKTVVGFMMDLDKELRASGELVFEEGLTFPNEAKLVRADWKATKPAAVASVVTEAAHRPWPPDSRTVADDSCRPANAELSWATHAGRWVPRWAAQS